MKIIESNNYKRIDVSCVVVGHRESHVIAATLKSVIRAIEYANLCGVVTEFLVVLDNPDDDTANVVSGFSCDSMRVEVVSYKDLAHSRNHAVNVCKGEYITFIDGDDLWCKSWIVNSYMTARQRKNTVFHPEYNIYFGSNDSHVLNHVDMDDSDFLVDAIYRANYWTALAFSERSIYETFRYSENRLSEGFGYEDWTWNVETISNGITHHVVEGTCHFIRRTRGNSSLLNITNSNRSLPTILPIYTSKSKACEV